MSDVPADPTRGRHHAVEGAAGTPQAVQELARRVVAVQIPFQVAAHVGSSTVGVAAARLEHPLAVEKAHLQHDGDVHEVVHGLGGAGEGPGVLAHVVRHGQDVPGGHRAGGAVGGEDLEAGRDELAEVLVVQQVAERSARGDQFGDRRRLGSLVADQCRVAAWRSGPPRSGGLATRCCGTEMLHGRVLD